MNDVLNLFLILSATGSVIALILFGIKFLSKNKFSNTWHYYIWLIVIVRLLLPFSIQIEVVDTFISYVENFTFVNDSTEIINTVVLDGESVQKTQAINYWNEIRAYAWLLWIGVSIALFIRKVTSYHDFVRFIKAGRHEVADNVILDIYKKACAALNVNKPLPLYANKMATAPMLVGISKPFIVLPTLGMSEDEIYNILIHELTHHKRLDVLYKWITQLAVCLHWFNPLVYLISHEINKYCELSCDEAIIKNLTADGKKKYGNTLITALKTNGNYGNIIISITLNEDANLLKTRLDAIKKYRKKSKFTICFSSVLTLILFCGALFTGAYAEANSPINDMLNENIENSLNAIKSSTKENEEDENLINADIEINNGKTVISLTNKNAFNISESGSFQVGNEQILSLEIKSSITGGMVDLFLFDPSSREQRITIGSSDFLEEIELVEGVWQYNCSGIFRDGGNLEIIGIIK